MIGLLGLPSRAAPVDLSEADHLLAEPLLAALNVALAKARAAVIGGDDETVVAADTLVVADGDVLGKPEDAASARAMLRVLRARPHEVVTGVVLRTADGREWAATVSSRVRMRAYSDQEVEAYVSRGEPFDKAGGYAIQDVEFRPVERIDGCYLNVVGLPLCAASAGLQALGIEAAETRDARLPPCGYCVAGSALVRI